MAAKSLNRIRMELLAECFGISAFTGFVGVFFLRSAFPVEPGMYFSIVMTVLVVLASTGIAQVLGNERWLQLIAGWLKSISGQEQPDDPKKALLASLRLLLFFMAVWVAVTIGLITVRKIVYLSITQCLELAAIGLASGVVFFAGWLLTQRWIKAEDAKARTVAEIADAFLRFPLRSATLSLGLWFYAGLAICLTFYCLIRLSAFTSYCTFTLAFSTGILAFPLQYLLFKRTLDPMVQRFAAQNPEAMQDTKLFSLSLRSKLLVYFLSLSLFTVAITFLINYSRAADLTKKKSAQLYEKQLKEEMDHYLANAPGLQSLKEQLAAKSTADESYFLVSPAGQALLGNPGKELSKRQMAEMLSRPSGALFPVRTDGVVVYQSLAAMDGLRAGKIYSAKQTRLELRDFRVISLILVVLVALACAAFAILASGEIFGPLKAMVEEAGLIAARDFSERAMPVTNDELNELAKSIVLMRSNIKSYVQDINSLVHKVESTVPKVDTTMQVLSMVAKEQAHGSAEQAASLEQVYGTVEKLTVIARQLSAKSQEIQSSAQQTSEAFNSGKSVLFSAIEAARSAEVQVTAILEFTKLLETHVKRIKDIVEIIEEISVQSNLLAFNALVESAASGETGRRFGVVANQMKRLALMTKEFNTNIGAIIKDMIQAVEKIAGATREGSEQMRQSLNLVTRAGESFQGFAGLIDLSVTTAKEVSSSMDFQARTSEEMSRSLAGLKTIARSLAGGTAEIERSSGELLQLAEELKVLTSRRAD